MHFMSNVETNLLVMLGRVVVIYCENYVKQTEIEHLRSVSDLSHAARAVDVSVF
jgi:hypothetical protein